jgi:hypothetical protein
MQLGQLHIRHTESSTAYCGVGMASQLDSAPSGERANKQPLQQQVVYFLTR